MTALFIRIQPFRNRDERVYWIAKIQTVCPLDWQIQREQLWRSYSGYNPILLLLLSGQVPQYGHEGNTHAFASLTMPLGYY